ncbi:Peptidoglycan endopeptidase RipA [Penicillium subrubescens]|uniref:Peptidoglycan endopeptidase RipA n=1 Tax=Penicillium subrubescens TaxID=1316194 RepID=A0A1Q5T2H1_9EURO|nr:Peptidoglycan endopeptidase RipA [Penicillium subrubescens]
MHFSLLALSAAIALPLASAYPVNADDLHCRSGPGTNYGIVKSYKRGTDLSITCQAAGTNVSGDELWDKTSDGCYVSDYYVKTGSSGYVTKHCDGGSTGGGSGGSGSGASIVNAAEKEKGLPYVWGGGGCDGPSGGGFDCSGLTQFSLCKALNKKIPRTAQTQYDATSQGKRIPRAEAKEGDLIFWGENGNCKSGVSHVGIFIRDGWMINAAHTGTPVREQAIWTSYGGESICPYAMRYDNTDFLDEG